MSDQTFSFTTRSATLPRSTVGEIYARVRASLKAAMHETFSRASTRTLSKKQLRKAVNQPWSKPSRKPGRRPTNSRRQAPHHKAVPEPLFPSRAYRAPSEPVKQRQMVPDFPVSSGRISEAWTSQEDQRRDMLALWQKSVDAVRPESAAAIIENYFHDRAANGKPFDPLLMVQAYQQFREAEKAGRAISAMTWYSINTSFASIAALAPTSHTPSTAKLSPVAQEAQNAVLLQAWELGARILPLEISTFMIKGHFLASARQNKPFDLDLMKQAHLLFSAVPSAPTKDAATSFRLIAAVFMEIEGVCRASDEHRPAHEQRPLTMAASLFAHRAPGMT